MGAEDAPPVRNCAISISEEERMSTTASRLEGTQQRYKRIVDTWDQIWNFLHPVGVQSGLYGEPPDPPSCVRQHKAQK